MSVKISGQVWELDLDPVDKLVLLALADHSDHDGSNVRPGNRLLIEKTGLSQPTISAKIKKFIEDGILDPQNGEDPGRGGVRAFTLDVSSVPRRGYFIEREEQKKVKAASRLSGNNIKAVSTLSGENIKAGDKNIKADNGNIKADSFSHDKERARVEPSEPSINRQGEETPSPVFAALEKIYPGHATNFRTMSELFGLVEKLGANALQVENFPHWLTENHPRKANSPFAFKDLFDSSIKTSHVQPPKRRFCGQCDNGWLPPAQGEKYARECQCKMGVMA